MSSGGTGSSLCACACADGDESETKSSVECDSSDSEDTVVEDDGTGNSGGASTGYRVCSSSSRCRAAILDKSPRNTLNWVTTIRWSLLSGRLNTKSRQCPGRRLGLGLSGTLDKSSSAWAARVRLHGSVAGRRKGLSGASCSSISSSLPASLQTARREGLVLACFVRAWPRCRDVEACRGADAGASKVIAS